MPKTISWQQICSTRNAKVLQTEGKWYPMKIAIFRKERMKNTGNEDLFPLCFFNKILKCMLWFKPKILALSYKVITCLGVLHMITTV